MRLITLRTAAAIVLTIIFVAPSPSADGKNTSGIYVTANDYQSGTLTSEGPCDSKGHNLELHDVLHKTYIHVTHGTDTRKYAKSELYGFRACDSREYRFVDNREYEILESSQISIYTAQVQRTRRATTRVYFFSAGPGGAVLPLTRNTLKRAFPDNHRFHDSLDQQFHTDKELAQYDDFHKMFKVNRLLMASSER